MLGRDAFMWSDRVGLKGATNGEHEVANSTACATVFAFKPKPMVRRMKESNIRATDHVTYATYEKRKARGRAALHQQRSICSKRTCITDESLEYDGR